MEYFVYIPVLCIVGRGVLCMYSSALSTVCSWGSGRTTSKQRVIHNYVKQIEKETIADFTVFGKIICVWWDKKRLWEYFPPILKIKENYIFVVYYFWRMNLQFIGKGLLILNYYWTNKIGFMEKEIGFRQKKTFVSIFFIQFKARELEMIKKCVIFKGYLIAK